MEWGHIELAHPKQNYENWRIENNELLIDIYNMIKSYDYEMNLLDQITFEEFTKFVYKKSDVYKRLS